MTFAKRFKIGLDVGLNSFGILWQHKRLLFYMGAPILIGITLELIIYNLSSLSELSPALFFHGIMMRIWSPFGWVRHLGMLFTQVVRLFVIIFASAALSYHAAQILRRRNTSIREAIGVCASKTKQIFFWSLIATSFFFFILQIYGITEAGTGILRSVLAALIGGLLQITWSLATLFVITGIALEKYPLKKIVMVSPFIIKKFFVEYLGAMCWIILVGILAFTPFLLFSLHNPLAQTIVYIILAFVGCVLSSVHTILKTTLYQAYKDRPILKEILLPPI